MFWKLTIAVVVVAGLAGAAYFSGVSTRQVREVLGTLGKTARKAEESLAHEDETKPVAPKHEPRTDGLLTVAADEEAALGLRVVTVEEQTQPLRLELSGRTAYDDTTLIKIRPRFDTQVEKVHAKLGQKIKTGDPLVELFSTDLAQAKSDYQSKYVQWQHDLRLFTARTDLYKQEAISRQLLVDTENDEKKSHLDYTLARDKLKILKVPDDQIAPLLVGLGDKNDVKVFGKNEEKAKLTLNSPAEGIVIEREVVPGNYYETSTVLMVIAPLDHLWVWANVYELDEDKVHLGQTMEIKFPYLEERIKGKVDYIANEVSKETRAVRIRATIPNPGTRLKSDMLLKAGVEIPIVKGHTVIPRQSMITMNGVGYVFVRKPPDLAAEPGTEKDAKTPDLFERRMIEVAQENTDNVVVASGLKAGEEVASTGSLILAQIYEDNRIVATGLPE